jgi:hypothetical protein
MRSGKIKKNKHLLPFVRFCRIASRNGGISGKGWLHSFPWITKTILIEPWRWVEHALYHKKIKAHRVHPAPIFILGHYRSGTTFLQRMLAQDDRLGFTSIFQTVLPEIMLTGEKPLTPLLELISRVFRLSNPFHRIPLQWKSFPGEEDVGVTALLFPSGSQWGQLFPQRMEQYLHRFILFDDADDEEKKQWKQDYTFFLKKISLANQGKPLVLKNPPHTARIKMLLSLFPEARFIHIMRDPLDVFASTQRLMEVIRKNYILGREDLDMDTAILRNYKAIMQAFLEQKNSIPGERFVEIRYEDFVKEPVRIMEKIYQHLQLPHFSYCADAAKDFANQQKKYPVLDHHIDPEMEKRIRREWDPFISYWEQLSSGDPQFSPAGTNSG